MRGACWTPALEVHYIDAQVVEQALMPSWWQVLPGCAMRSWQHGRMGRGGGVLSDAAIKSPELTKVPMQKPALLSRSTGRDRV